MKKDRLSIYNSMYRSKSKIGDNNSCFTCGEKFNDFDIIHICYNNSKAKRRHVKCAIQKNMLLDDIVKEMDESINRALRTLFKK